MASYAQIDDLGCCVSVSYLSGTLEANNMISLHLDDDVQPGDKWGGKTWSRPDDPPDPPEQITQ